jgi:hypothetical protein
VNEILLILHLFGFGAVFSGFFGSFFVTTASNAAPAEAAPTLARLRPYFAGFAHAGILILIITGPLLLWLKWNNTPPYPTMFWLKMLFVVILLGISGFMAANGRRARNGDMVAAGRIPIYNRLVTTAFLLILVFAVLAFG